MAIAEYTSPFPVDNITITGSQLTNPLIWNAPPTNAFHFNPYQSTSLGPVNPNEANKTAAANKQNPTSGATPKSKTSGYESLVNGHNVTAQELSALEVQTNLTLYPYLFGGELARIKHQYSNLDNNKYYLLLNLLVYGFDNKILSSSTYGGQKTVIDKGFINDFMKMAKQPLLQEALKKTPAYQKGCFDDIGKTGVTEVNADNMSSSPITGPSRNHPSLIENMLNSVYPNAVTDLEKFCNAIRTHSYLSLPKGAFGSLQKIVSGINGVIQAFQNIINDIYNGIILYVQQIYAWINGIVAQLQKELLQMIEDIIPLDLICLLLDTLQCILDDVNFFTSLFNMSGSFMNTLNSIQNFVNIASNVAGNPFSAVSAYLPANVNNIINQVNQIGTDPGGFLADQLSNHGYAYVAQALQGNIMGALVNKFGPQYAAITPLGNLLTQSGAILNKYGQGAQSFPPVAASLGPNIYNGNREDIYGHPVDSGSIGQNVASDYDALTQSLNNIGTGLSQTASDVGNKLKSFL
jgi:hypothetical protein